MKTLSFASTPMSIPTSVRAFARPPVGRGLPAHLLRTELSALYAQSQENRHLFASPLGPFLFAGRSVSLPRFVFFGPQASDDAWRLAFLAGLDSRDLHASRALLALVQHLAANAADGTGLNLTFFPLVDAAGFFLGENPRALAGENWRNSAAPEIGLLQGDARARGYHGFIRVESSTAESDVVVVQVRQPPSSRGTPDLELISSAETEPFPVRFESIPDAAPAVSGPQSIADRLPVRPFELVLQIPSNWPGARYRAAATHILTRFVFRYRAFQAYGQHL